MAKKANITDQLFEPISGGQRTIVPERMNQNVVKPNDPNKRFEAITATGEIYKATIPGWLYNPTYGVPTFKDVPEIRRLAATPYVAMIGNTISNEIKGLDWKIKVVEGEDVPEDVVKDVTRMFKKPNQNNQNISNISSRNVRDLLDIGQMVTEKAYNLKGDFTAFMARDAGLFLKNPDIHGILPEERAYWQYSWTYTSPIPFALKEIAWADYNERTDQEYGRGPVENLLDVLQLLLYGTDSNLEYFNDNSIPKGVFMMEGAEKDAVDNFAEQLRDSMRTRDPAGKWRKYFHKMPVINQAGKFERISFSNLELDLIEQQKWYMKIVWACFGITADELGFTEDSNRATGVMQSSTFKRKVLRPFMETLEQCYDTNIINSHPRVIGKYEGKLMFEFDKTDLGLELQERQIGWGDFDRGIITLNEFREKSHMPKAQDGDKFSHEIRAETQAKQMVGSNPFKQNTANTAGPEKEKEANADTLNKSAEEKSLPSGAPYQVKALTTSSPVRLQPFDEPGEYQQAFKDSFEQMMKRIVYEIEHTDIGETETKALGLEAILDRIISMVQMGTTAVLGFKMIKDSYEKGLDKAGKETNRNYIPDDSRLTFLQKYTFGNIKDLTTETRNDLRQSLMRGIMEKKKRSDIVEDVKGIMESSQHRAETIVSTEMNRASNAGALQGYQESGLKGFVVWNAIGDHKADDICAQLDGQKVPVGESFEAKGFSSQGPPVHPNCRCRVTFEAGEK